MNTCTNHAFTAIFLILLKKNLSFSLVKNKEKSQDCQ